MGWLLELLFEGIKELCSQFIIDMMDVASSMFTEILSCDLDLFEELFGVAGDLYRNGIMPIAIMILLMILVWQLFKGMFGKITASSEEPLELIFRSAISLFMIAYAKDIVNYILDIVGTPYQWVVGTAVTVNSFSGYVTAAEAVVSVLGIDVISIQMLLLILHFVVAWNYFKMLFILAERYVLLGIFSYTAPLAFAAGGSKSTNNITTSWVRMFGGQVLIVILDAWCLKMFLSGYGNIMASSYGFTKFFAATMCLIGFSKITAKLDSYMASLGVNLGRIGGGLSGMGALLMAGRLLHMGGGSGRAGGGNTDKGASHMTFGSGKPIPMGRGTPDFGAEGMSGMQNSSSVGGMNSGMNAGESQEAGEDFGWHGAEADFNGYDNEMPGAGTADMPFGMPDESGYEPQESYFDGLDSAEGAEDLSADQEPLPFDEAGMPMDGSYADAAEAGEIPGMGYSEEGPFGPAYPEAEEMPGTGYGTEENSVSGPGGMAQDTGMDMPAEGGGVSGMQENAGAETVPDAEMQGSGVLSYAGGESALAEGHADTAQGGTETAPSGYAGSLEGPVSAVHSGMPGGGAEETGAVGTSTAETSAGGTNTAGIHAAETGAAGGIQSHSPGTGGSVSGGSISGSVSSAENTHGAEGVSAGGMQGASAAEAGTAAGTYVQSGQAGPAGDSGSYLAERDGERYMRYDASQYEKPQGAYQTIHEDGKTYYEIPEKDKMPAVLPETKAVLEKNGTIRLEKVYKEPPQERRIPDQAPEKKPEGKKNTKKKPPGNRGKT